MYYIGGLLKHGPACCAFAAPTINSYRRLVPGFEAPVNLVYSQRNRSAAIRIPIYSKSEKSKRIEFRCPDNPRNPYLALRGAADGRSRRRQEQDRSRATPPTSTSTRRAGRAGQDQEHAGLAGGSAGALEHDHDFLLEGGVFTEDLIDSWIDYKRANESTRQPLRSTPYEFYLYFDV